MVLKTQILEAQNASSSAMLNLMAEISNLSSQIGHNTNELIRSYATDTLVANGIDSIIALLQNNASSLALELLCKAYLTKNDVVNAKAVRDVLFNTYGNYNFVKLFDIYLQLLQDLSTCIKINTDQDIKSRIEQIANDPSDRVNCTKAEALLEHALNVYYPAPIENLNPIGSGRSMMFEAEEENNNNQNISLLLYPNPSTGMLNIELSNSENNLMNIWVYDMFGKLIYQTQTANTKTQVDLSKLPRGIYSVKVESNHHTEIKCVVISK